MKKLAIASVLVLGVALAFAGVLFAESLKSGPQIGEELAGPFHPLNINGESAGQKACLYCKNGNNPVAMVFARGTSDALTKLIKKIDTCTEKNSDAKMGSFVVFLNDSEDLPNKLKDLVEKEKINQTVLAVDNPAGPRGYKVAKDADVTVVLYRNHVVKANYAFASGQLKDEDIEKIVGDLPKILAKE
jgi:hypothetical protein